VTTLTSISNDIIIKMNSFVLLTLVAAAVRSTAASEESECMAFCTDLTGKLEDYLGSVEAIEDDVELLVASNSSLLADLLCSTGNDENCDSKINSTWHTIARSGVFDDAKWKPSDLCDKMDDCNTTSLTASEQCDTCKTMVMDGADLMRSVWDNLCENDDCADGLEEMIPTAMQILTDDMEARAVLTCEKLENVC